MMGSLLFLGKRSSLALQISGLVDYAPHAKQIPSRTARCLSGVAQRSPASICTTASLTVRTADRLPGVDPAVRLSALIPNPPREKGLGHLPPHIITHQLQHSRITCRTFTL